MNDQNSDNTLHLNFDKGVLSLRLGSTELFREAIASSPSKIILSLEGVSNLLTSCSSRNINGASRASCVIKKIEAT
jgi:hypothetical protein